MQFDLKLVYICTPPTHTHTPNKPPLQFSLNQTDSATSCLPVSCISRAIKLICSSRAGKIPQLYLFQVICL